MKIEIRMVDKEESYSGTTILERTTIQELYAAMQEHIILLLNEDCIEQLNKGHVLEIRKDVPSFYLEPASGSYICFDDGVLEFRTHDSIGKITCSDELAKIAATIQEYLDDEPNRAISSSQKTNNQRHVAGDKYKILETVPLIHHSNKTLRQICALRDFADVKAGDLGGYVENERNLSQEGDCWIYNRACAYDYSRVYGNAQVREFAEVKGAAQVYDNALVQGEAVIRDEAKVYGNAQVYDEAIVRDFATVNECAEIHGNVKIMDNATVTGKILLLDNLTIDKNATVSGEGSFGGEMKIRSDLVSR